MYSVRRLATGSGTIGDAAYLVHEIAEVEELQRIQRQTGFDFMGRNIDALPREERQQWPFDFDRYYRAALMTCKAITFIKPVNKSGRFGEGRSKINQRKKQHTPKSPNARGFRGVLSLPCVVI
jgi:hypothetical protein